MDRSGRISLRFQILASSPHTRVMRFVPASARSPCRRAACARRSDRFRSTRKRSTSRSTARATVNVNASIASLVALRGVDLPTDPRARVDRGDVRRFFEGPGARVTSVSLSRRHTRRFAHVAIDVDDVRKLSRLAPFAWSRYRLDARGDARGLPAAGRQAQPAARVSNVGWDGSEIVAFRMHIPSEILFHNTDGRAARQHPGVGSAADRAAQRRARSTCR